MEWPMLPVITAFRNSPDRGQGHARDMRVRWALEEVGQPYDVKLMTFDELKTPEYRRLHPFGQIPTFDDGGPVLFESGAIVWHIANKHTGLLPKDPDGKARALTWIFAAIDTVEPPIFQRALCMVLERDKPWFAERLELLDQQVRSRLGSLSQWLGDAEWLDDDFSAADLVMVTVLRRLESSDLLKDYPAIAAYLNRGTGRPAFKRAFATQLAVFQDTQAHPGQPPEV